MRRAYLRQPGCLVQANSGRLLLGITITLIVLCVASKSAKFDLDLNNWIQQSSRIQNELNYIVNSIGEGTGSNSELIIQTPVSASSSSSSSIGIKNILNVDALMIHLEAMAIATHLTIDLFDVTWSLKDLCFRPTLPNFEGFELSILLDKMMPCNIKTPLDCFWEGAKLHQSSSGDILPNGQQPFGLKKWTEFDPIKTIKLLQYNHKHSSFDYQSLIDWMDRVGIKHGYQRKPCLDPSDPLCPDTAPNKLSKSLPNIGKELTGGCYGVAENQMHWREEEIVGGSIKNKTGYIIKANAIQSSIPLMCEQDMYDYWRKTEQTQDITNWSVEKAKIILETWERRFKEELQQFAKSLLPLKSGQKIHSMTTKSMLEPIDIDLLLDYKNFLLSFSLMTLIICISFPKFINYDTMKGKNEDYCLDRDYYSDKEKQLETAKNNQELKNETKQTKVVENIITKINYIDKSHTLLLALATSLSVGLTFISSLGLSTFLNLPFNMATTQILPPIALYYGFNQLNTIVNIYSQKFGVVPIEKLTTSCLDELFPIIMIESISYSIALLVTTIIPIPATRALALQAITYIFTATFVSIVLIPAIITTFLLRYHTDLSYDYSDDEEDTNCEDRHIKHKSTTGGGQKGSGTVVNNKSKLKQSSRGKNKCAKETNSDDSESGEVDHIFSRIQDDLKNIQKDSRNNTPTDLNFSTQINVDEIQTSLQENNQDSSSTNVPSKVHNTMLSKDLLINSSLLPDLLALPTCKTSLNHLPVATKNPDLSNSYTINNSLKKMNDSYEKDYARSVNEHKIVDIYCDDLKTKLEDIKSIQQSIDEAESKEEEEEESSDKSIRINSNRSYLIECYIKILTTNRFFQATICLIKLVILISLLPYAQKVKYGLHLKDIVGQGTEQFDSFSAQEKYFSVYNIFAITKGNFDYPSNQKLLHEYYNSIIQIDGIVEDKNVSKFWLVAFRDWLLDIQNKFDIDRNESRILVDGWTPDASDSAKLGYKLLAQTGKIDYPIDRALVGTNRLVDSKGIINQKAFYHYLTAWVSCDAYVYATTEANFRPEPKIMNDNPDNLRIEKARPLLYTQIPFLMKLPPNQGSFKVITDIRTISQMFEQLNLPNFPTGIPFIFWDQIINLEVLMITSLIIGIFSIFVVIFLMTSDMNTTIILTIPIILTLLELYCLIGYLSVPFNNILAVLLIGSIGLMMIQTVPYVTCFTNKKGNLLTRTAETIQSRLRIVITSLTLLFLCSLVFYCSRIVFMNKYSYLLLCLFLLNLFNTLFITPIVLSLFGSNYKPKDYHLEAIECKTVKNSTLKMRTSKDKSNVCKTRSNKSGNSGINGIGKGSRKKRGYPRKVQSEISLSTISEEQLEAPCVPA